MIIAWLVVNYTLMSEKYSEMNSLLQESATRHGIDLQIKTNAELLSAAVMGERVFPIPDFVLFWDKDVTLCRLLEGVGARVFNSASAIASCDNKGLTHAILAGHDIPMPRTIAAPLVFSSVQLDDFVKNAGETLGYPLIIKESFGSFGMQVYKADSYIDAVDIANSISPKQMIFQEYIESSAGRDVRLNVVGDEVVASMERVAHDDFRANVTLGGSMKQYFPTDEEKKLAVSAANALGLDFCGVDILFDRGKPLICEVNSNAHVKNILDCTGINTADCIFSHILSKIGR